jgi:tetratricopeptide (TPR) repeat protein
MQLGNYPEAERHNRLALEQAWYETDHAGSAKLEDYVAQALNWKGRYEESQRLLKHALVVTERTYGKSHPLVALALSSLGTVDFQFGKLDAAETDFVRMAAIYHATYGDQHELTAIALCNLASVYSKKQYARAARVLSDVIQIYARALPSGHLNIAIAHIGLGRALVEQKRFREAEEHTLGGYKILSESATPSGRRRKPRGPGRSWLPMNPRRTTKAKVRRCRMDKSALGCYFLTKPPASRKGAPASYRASMAFSPPASC